MHRSRQRNHPRQWPFWLLLFAWLCASSPVHLTGAAVDWIGEAHSFSHQKRLTLDVARLLVGEKSPVNLGTSENLPAPPPKPALPAGGSAKKGELAMEETIESRRPCALDTEFTTTPARRQSALRAPPPHEPPRATA